MAWTAPPAPAADPRSGAGSASASTSAAGAASALRDLLGAFFAAYLEDAPEVRRPAMSALLARAHAAGLVGPDVVPALAALHAALRPEMDADGAKFAAFYHFVFFLARPGGHRHLPRDVAVETWRFALADGRFALLEPWLDFVASRDPGRGISEDTWCQARVRSDPDDARRAEPIDPPRGRTNFFDRVIRSHPPDDPRVVLDFAVAVARSGSLDGYDPHGAWPVLVDEFVDALRPSPPPGAHPPRPDDATTRMDADDAADDLAADGRWGGGGGGGGTSGTSAEGLGSFSRRGRVAGGFGRGDASSAVYNGGSAGGAGRGVGSRWDVAPGRRGGPSGEPETPGSSFLHASSSSYDAARRESSPAPAPSVGCKRRLSAVLEVESLADRLGVVRVRSPFGSAASGLDEFEGGASARRNADEQMRELAAKAGGNPPWGLHPSGGEGGEGGGDAATFGDVAGRSPTRKFARTTTARDE